MPGSSLAEHGWRLAAIAAALAAAGCGSDRPGKDAQAPADAAPPNAAAPPDPQPPPAPVRWSASGYALDGAEPFWGGTVTGTEIRYMTPEKQFGELISVTAAHNAEQQVYTGSLGGRPFVLTLSRGPCSNGMSDHSYAYTATLRVRGETRRGCADAQ
jgi:uncharacterized membrane protein